MTGNAASGGVCGGGLGAPSPPCCPAWPGEKPDRQPCGESRSSAGEAAAGRAPGKREGWAARPLRLLPSQILPAPSGRRSPPLRIGVRQHRRNGPGTLRPARPRRRRGESPAGMSELGEQRLQGRQLLQAAKAAVWLPGSRRNDLYLMKRLMFIIFFY